MRQERLARAAEYSEESVGLYEFLRDEFIHFDHLCVKTGMNAGKLSATLTILELNNLAVRKPGDFYAKAP